MINYIILAHKNPAQVHRLINRLDQSEVFFYVHVDRNTDIGPFLLHKPNVFFLLEREPGTWGGLGIVKATLHALRQIITDKRDGYCVLLSGQDYPIKSNAFIKNFFANSLGCFLSPGLIIGSNLPQKIIDRVSCYKYDLPDTNGEFVELPSLFSFRRYHVANLFKLLKKGIVPFAILRKRQYKKVMHAFGSQWFAMPLEAVTEMLSYVDSNPDFLRFHERTLLADEIFFNSLVLHLGLQTHGVVTYVDWSRHLPVRPAVFGESDLPKLLSVRHLFARKFEQDSLILDLLDAHT